MKKSEFRALESQLTELPYDQKKQLKNWLSALIESQAESLIDATPESFCCRHCGSDSKGLVWMSWLG